MVRLCSNCDKKNVCYIQREFNIFSLKLINRPHAQKCFSGYAKYCDDYREKDDEK